MEFKIFGENRKICFQKITEKKMNYTDALKKRPQKRTFFYLVIKKYIYMQFRVRYKLE